jgi:hypothetical protein
MKKIIFGFIASMGLLVAVPAFGAVVAPTTITGKTTIQSTAPTSGMMQTQVTSQPIYSAQPAQSIRSMPCDTLQLGTGSNMMYGNPCGRAVFNSYPATPLIYGNHQAQWYELMFILTVMLVWVVLLLLIGVLWKQLHHKK